MKRNLLKSLFLGLSILFLAQFSYAQLNVTPVSGPNLCDGTAALSNPSSVIQSSITWYGNGAIIATNTYQIGNLCPGNYGVSYVQSNPVGGLDSLNASFFISGGVNPCANFNVTLTTTPCSTVSSNDGSISPNVTGGTAPYMYLWSQGSVTQDIINLIPGFTYCVNVTDMNGCQMMVCDSMTVSGTNTGDTLVVNNANCGPAAVGNFVQQYEDCNFDFNACTSASMTSNMTIGNDTLLTVWTFVDSNNVAIGTYTIYYYIPNGIGNGCVNLQFILYCPIKSTNIKTIVVNDMVQLSGLNEMVKNPFSVNNPMGNELSVQFDEVTSGTMRLYNMNGQLVKTQSLLSVQQATIATTNLPAGTYFFQLEVGSTVYTQKVIK
ncbi:MAG: T9SS type A sorting domain-containing protein [Crocinitomicaceae bacterium]|nr:T9SS type A sorting domain-containing protein [Crocinitomicaceae bacterium]MBP6032574.1 T9SS type A sorting domain-containing protein [Crocinitomicaceae bacterium]